MFHLELYLEKITGQLSAFFGRRFLYLGLQGSYLRGEETPQSDLDLMLVLEELSPQDLDSYRCILSSLPCPIPLCGFVCSLDDLLHWNAGEVCHVLHSTKDCFGHLKDLAPGYSREAVVQYVKLQTGNLYHELCHRYLYASREENLQALENSYRQVFFILQNAQYLRTGHFPQTKALLLEELDGPDHQVLQRHLEMQRNPSSQTEEAFQKDFSLLLGWCQKLLKETFL